jgi:CDP-glycerol glycerophosphotransferase (TagB/SpsB family)
MRSSKSAVRWIRDFVRLGFSLLGAALGWFLIAPIAALVPKRRDWVAVIGRQHGMFLDNAKYFFIEAASVRKELDIRFISEHPGAIGAISGHGLRALYYPRLESIWFLLRCGCVIVDSMDWARHFRRFLLIRARAVQLWHGVGFKRIERDRWRHETGRARWASTSWIFALRMLLYRINGRLVRYAAVCCTSRFYRDEVFAPAFDAQHFPITGYPRNAFGRIKDRGNRLVWYNADSGVSSRLRDWADQGQKIVVVAPTFRDSGAAPMMLDPATIEALDVFCEAHGFEFVFKLHPSEPHANQIAGTHLHVCGAASDLYPLLAHADALITDYSSIYMDFLLLDRPVLFLIFDDSYAKQDRQTQFDIGDMTPGPRTASWSELLRMLKEQLQCDTFSEERARLRQLAFDEFDQSEAVSRLLDFMHAQHWLPKTRDY